jgi:hypothetical protein
MLMWIENHGMEALLIWIVLAAAINSMPVLPDNAGYWTTWTYGFLHMVAANLKAQMAMKKGMVPPNGFSSHVETDKK